MVSSLACFVSQRARNIYGGMSVVLAGAGYIGAGVVASTAVGVAVSFAKYCPNHGEPVTTPLGTMTCTQLSVVVADQGVLLPLFAWTVPVIASAASVFVVYKLASAKTSSQHTYQPLVVDTSAQSSITGSVTSGGEYDFHTARSHFSGNEV